MVPGIYKDVPFADYLAIDAASNSRLKDIDRSPAYCRYRIDNPSETESPYMTLGSAVHCAILEPAEFDARYCPKPQVLKDDGVTVWGPTSNAHKDAIAALESRGLTPLSESQYEMATGIRETVETHAGARSLLGNATATELTAVAAVWDASGRAVLAKVRPDIICESVGVIGEVKTTTDGSPEAFSRKIHDYGYHRAAALYCDVMRTLGFEAKAHVFLVLETEPPYLARTYTLSESAMNLGRMQYQRALTQYGDCTESGKWPGPPQDVRSIDLPAWAYTREENNG